MRQVVEFVKCSPTQNMTILVKTKHPASQYGVIASQMMNYGSIHAEQVGFILEPRSQQAAAQLYMAGGEYCGNACMALAVHLATELDLPSESTVPIVLEASGTEALITCHVTRVNDKYVCEAGMPMPKSIEQKVITYESEQLDIVIVRYESCIHLIIETDCIHQRLRDQAEAIAKLLGATLDTDLIGIMLYCPNHAELAPLIYVPGLNSLVWERGCGSGTASIGACLAWRQKGRIAAEVKQPGGIIQVKADWHDGAPSEMTIKGVVEIVAHGKAYVDLDDY
ncbi:diaminopimelate epimerase [Paenibacillus sp. J5C_2022]|uniref:diaminopimelate epimerase n=1 Tax=Paenibacillus sp. J5C2022 TaxID=2977129 RepID=UPI0021D07AB5|nr:diaminopimelate epimerase [Paenibacillus sp. J5C2022]MCU6711753.1 diaminopimelate epimerase [Paenibacillus sp. J5C2022]